MYTSGNRDVGYCSVVSVMKPFIFDYDVLLWFVIVEALYNFIICMLRAMLSVNIQKY